MYINKYDKTGECALIGDSVESIFEQWLIKNKRSYRRASLNEQYKHIDFIIGENTTIDIKAPKKKERYSDYDCSILWVEFKNVQGKTGWLYGENEFIAFYQPIENVFYVVKTKDLAELCEQLCNQGITNSAKDALYKRYTRKGRKDEISMIMFDDLKKIQYWRLEC